jgi:hypothetical protein
MAMTCGGGVDPLMRGEDRRISGQVMCSFMVKASLRVAP